VSLQNKLAVTVSTASTHVGGHSDTTRGARTSLRNTGSLTKNWRDEFSHAYVQNVCADSWDEAIVTQGERMDGPHFVTDGGLRVHVDV
jgi:hypothetical protein